MLKVVVVTPFASGSELLRFVKKYVPFRASCPIAPVTLTRFELASQPEFGQSPGFRSPWGVAMVTFAVVPEFTIEINFANELFETALPKVDQKVLGDPNEWPNST